MAANELKMYWVGDAFYGLWDYEVAEVFFLADNCNNEPDYLELEFGPHGQHLGLYLHGVRNSIKHSFPIEYEVISVFIYYLNLMSS